MDKLDKEIKLFYASCSKNLVMRLPEVTLGQKSSKTLKNNLAPKAGLSALNIFLPLIKYDQGAEFIISNGLHNRYIFLK